MYKQREFVYYLLGAGREMGNSFGILNQRFQIYHRLLNSEAENVDQIIITTCILRNFIIKQNVSSLLVRLEILFENSSCARR
jgi:hypothetical protein